MLAQNVREAMSAVKGHPGSLKCRNEALSSQTPRPFPFSDPLVRYDPTPLNRVKRLSPFSLFLLFPLFSLFFSFFIRENTLSTPMYPPPSLRNVIELKPLGSPPQREHIPLFPQEVAAILNELSTFPRTCRPTYYICMRLSCACFLPPASVSTVNTW